MQAMVLPAATFSVQHGSRSYTIGINATVMGNPPKHYEVHHVCRRDDGVMVKVKPATVAALQPGNRPVDREAALRALKKNCNSRVLRGAQAGAAPRALLPNAPNQRRDVMTAGFKCASRIVIVSIGYALLEAIIASNKEPTELVPAPALLDATEKVGLLPAPTSRLHNSSSYEFVMAYVNTFVTTPILTLWHRANSMPSYEHYNP